MKKLLLLFSLCFIFGLACLPVYAHAETSPATVTAFTPTTEEQYQSLSAPVDVWYDDGAVAVAGSGYLSLYDFSSGALYFFDQLTANTGIARYGDFVFFISENKLKYINYKTGDTAYLNPEDVIACEAFSLYGDALVCSQSKNTVLYFDLSVNQDGVPVAQKNEQRCFPAANSLVYLTQKGEEQMLYYYSDHYVFRRSESGAILGMMVDGDIRRMAAVGDVVYYTTPTGLYCLDFSTSKSAVSYAHLLSGDVSLLSFTAPYGIAFRGDNLLVADSGNNAVQEFNPTANDGAGEFTGYAITTFGDMKGRLSSNAMDVAADETARYFADSGNKRVQIVSTEDGTVTAIPLPFTPERVMPGERNIFVAGQDGVTPVYALIDRKNLTANVTPVTDENIYSSIVSVTYTNGYFYFVTTDLGTKQGKLFGLRESDGSLRVLYERNTPIAVASDVSGTVYYCYKFGSEIRMRVEMQGDWIVRDETQDVLLQSAPIKLQADFESNVYALCENNTVLRYAKDGDYTQVTEYTLSLAPNLLAQFTTAPKAVSFAFTFAVEDVTVLYPDGLAGSTVGLAIATPLHVAVPTDLSLLSPDAPLTGGTHPEIKTVTAGNNLYLFDLAELSKNGLSYFPYKKFIRLHSDLTVIVAGYTGNYAVVTFADDSDGRFATALVATAHLTDAGVPTATEPSFAEGHTLTRVNAFKFPLIAEYFSVTKVDGEPVGLQKASPVLPIKEYVIYNYHLHNDGTVDGEYRYYDAMFPFGEQTVRAYLPASMIAQSLVEHASTVTYRLQTISPKKNAPVVLYSDQTMQIQLAVITQKTQVRVYATDGETALVGYEDESGVHFGYLAEKHVADDGTRAPVTIAVILLFALSLLATAIFFITRPKNKEE